MVIVDGGDGVVHFLHFGGGVWGISDVVPRDTVVENVAIVMEAQNGKMILLSPLDVGKGRPAVLERRV